MWKKYLKSIGWRDYKNGWDKREIIIDLITVTFIVTIIVTLIYIEGVI